MKCIEFKPPLDTIGIHWDLYKWERLLIAGMPSRRHPDVKQLFHQKPKIIQLIVQQKDLQNPVSMTYTAPIPPLTFMNLDLEKVQHVYIFSYIPPFLTPLRFPSILIGGLAPEELATSSLAELPLTALPPEMREPAQRLRRGPVVARPVHGAGAPASASP